jgi:hypothetical protein
MVKAKALREGESLIVYQMPAQREILDADCIQTREKMVYITYTYHYVARNAVLCWSFTNFSFLRRWPTDGVCRCMYDDDFALQLRQHTQMNAGCAVYAKKSRRAMDSVRVDDPLRSRGRIGVSACIIRRSYSITR